MITKNDLFGIVYMEYNMNREMFEKYYLATGGDKWIVEHLWSRFRDDVLLTLLRKADLE